MKIRIVTVAVASAALLLGAGLCNAAQGSAASAPAVSTKTKPTAPGERRASAQTNAPKPAPVKLVDINSASQKELMTLPGITEAEAKKIIAGRPFASKAHLVSRNIIDDGSYQAISKLIVAKQPYKDGNKNAALYAPKK